MTGLQTINQKYFSVEYSVPALFILGLSNKDPFPRQCKQSAAEISLEQHKDFKLWWTMVLWADLPWRLTLNLQRSRSSGPCHPVLWPCVFSVYCVLWCPLSLDKSPRGVLLPRSCSGGALGIEAYHHTPLGRRSLRRCVWFLKWDPVPVLAPGDADGACVWL